MLPLRRSTWCAMAVMAVALLVMSASARVGEVQVETLRDIATAAQRAPATNRGPVAVLRRQDAAAYNDGEAPLLTPPPAGTKRAVGISTLPATLPPLPEEEEEALTECDDGIIIVPAPLPSDNEEEVDTGDHGDISILPAPLPPLSHWRRVLQDFFSPEPEEGDVLVYAPLSPQNDSDSASDDEPAFWGVYRRRMEEEEALAGSVDRGTLSRWWRALRDFFFSSEPAPLASGPQRTVLAAPGTYSPAFAGASPSIPRTG